MYLYMYKDSNAAEKRSVSKGEYKDEKDNKTDPDGGDGRRADGRGVSGG